jgi:hypothetical protein
MKNIAKALALFHAKMSPVGKDKTNPHFRNKYASLDNILEAIKEPLQKANHTVVQLPTEGAKLRTILIETESGESIESTMDILLAKQDPQAQGSALTYARRYALSALLGISTDEDDDGEASTPKPTAPAPTAAKLCNKCGKPHTGPYPTCYSCHTQRTPTAPTGA